MNKEHGHSGSNWTCKHMHTWTHLAHWMPELTLAYLEKRDSFSVVRFSFVLIFNWIFMTLKKKKRTEPRTFVCSANAQSTGKLQSWEAGHQCSRSGFLPSPGTANSTELWELLKADCSRRTSPFHTSWESNELNSWKACACGNWHGLSHVVNGLSKEISV